MVWVWKLFTTYTFFFYFFFLLLLDSVLGIFSRCTNYSSNHGYGLMKYGNQNTAIFLGFNVYRGTAFFAHSFCDLFFFLPILFMENLKKKIHLERPVAIQNCVLSNLAPS